MSEEMGCEPYVRHALAVEHFATCRMHVFVDALNQGNSSDVARELSTASKVMRAPNRFVTAPHRSRADVDDLAAACLLCIIHDIM
jgi:hypothetical protein